MSVDQSTLDSISAQIADRFGLDTGSFQDFLKGFTFDTSNTKNTQLAVIDAARQFSQMTSDGGTGSTSGGSSGSTGFFDWLGHGISNVVGVVLGIFMVILGFWAATK
ncbi:MAG TPA: hypothetical protein VFM46_06580 [Pseudomonadales bacterium]|nr:hypothetical protein [Pseudomonadales bacterium]